jgi:hypothetical protein
MTFEVEELELLISENKSRISTLAFSKLIHKKIDNIQVHIDILEVKSLYAELLGNVSDINRNHAFLIRGTGNIETGIRKKNDLFYLTPQAAYTLGSICDDIEYPKPSWLPLTFQTIAPQGYQHKNLYLFNWSTVIAPSIPSQHLNFMRMHIQSDLTDVISSKPNIAINNNATIGNSRFQHIVSTEKKSLANQPITAEAEHGLFVAHKYIQTQRSAHARGLTFSISISELDNILSKKVCHFTGEELIHYQHNTENGEELPRNYLTLDRLDNDKGYIPGNVVACSKEINTMKGTMSMDEFNVAMAFKQLVQSKGFSSAQLKMIANA